MPKLQPTIAPLSLVQHDSYETKNDTLKCPSCDTFGCCGNDIVFQDYEIDDYFEDLHNQENRHFLDPVENLANLKEN
jgi:hypothetical protein